MTAGDVKSMGSNAKERTDVSTKTKHIIIYSHCPPHHRVMVLSYRLIFSSQQCQLSGVNDRWFFGAVSLWFSPFPKFHGLEHARVSNKSIGRLGYAWLDAATITFSSLNCCRQGKYLH